MHKEPEQFIASVKRQYPEAFTGKRVLEVGSLDINGSVRRFFANCDYTGIDIGGGKGVDVVSKAHEFVQPQAYDTIISTEMLEHDRYWNQSLRQMYENLKVGGLLIITCAAPNRPEHGTVRAGNADASPFTSDYYRNISVEDFASVLPANLFSRSYLGYRGNMDDLYFVGVKQGEKKLTVTAEISTKDRYHVLSLAIASIINQTRKPDRLVIYDDGEQKDLRTMPPFDGLLHMAVDAGMSLETFTTPREGQVKNHQHALDNAQTSAIWRIDDDEIAEPNCLENLLAEMKDGVGAVAGLVHHPGGVSPLPANVDGSLNDVSLGVNLQWFSLNGSGPREVEHLYSTFLFSVEAAKKSGGYPLNLSKACHREETIFSHSLRRAGYKLIVTPKALTHHLRQSTGGIRSYSDTSLWEHDEQVFQEYLKAWGVVQDDTKMFVLDCGIGDHWAFRSILPKLREMYQGKKIVLAVCYPQCFDGEDVTLISIADAQRLLGDKYADSSIYKWAWEHDRNGPLAETMLAMLA